MRPSRLRNPLPRCRHKQETAQEQPAPKPLRAAALAAKIEQAATGRDIIIETDLVKATVNTAGGVITGWELKHYTESDKTPVGLIVMYHKIMGQAPKVETPKKVLGNVQLLPDYAGIDKKDMVAPLTMMPLDKELYKLSQVDYHADHDAIRLGTDKKSETLVLTYAGPAGLQIEKRLTFYNDAYKVDVVVNTRGLNGYDLSLGTDFGLADKASSDASGRVGLVEQTDGKVITEKLGHIKGEVQHTGSIEWFAQEDKYFTAAVIYGGQGL